MGSRAARLSPVAAVSLWLGLVSSGTPAGAVAVPSQTLGIPARTSPLRPMRVIWEEQVATAGLWVAFPACLGRSSARASLLPAVGLGQDGVGLWGLGRWGCMGRAARGSLLWKGLG